MRALKNEFHYQIQLNIFCEELFFHPLSVSPQQRKEYFVIHYFSRH